ncbi:MAG: alpha-amylase family glycosyl hydrolase [Bacillota bacterium]|jgi:cyclomaltodextrinase|nr:alpha-amylase family glycosyl hydrolase [Bacillota bacterium]MDY0118505.1 alpha-amylase family glycosyl hydrolase [Bacilli bacterium]HOF65685.1 alpha-amylase family glycosyl hydrolase [Bacilli bacterium]HPK86357.1 alpha-amylase family glycosyl hydrolase [Bacilli bacterium]
MLIYQVFVRNFSNEGTFAGVITKLDEICKLKPSYLYLLPIHPIGIKDRKGDIGSPYSIKDYLVIDEELGGEKQFTLLIEECKKRNLKVMIDIVFHHTSRDAIYIETNPEWYIYKNGRLANKVGDWSDIADLDFDNQSLQKFLIDVLLHYVRMGVEGFRCDVASLVPVSFWQKARKKVHEINPDVIFLAESIEPSFIEYVRGLGEYAATDKELYEDAFDVLYDYDIYPTLKNYLKTEKNLQKLVHVLNKQNEILGERYFKLRFLENHDQERISKLSTGKNQLYNLIALSFYLPGSSFIYAGQEFGIKKLPNLFTKDVVDFKDKDLSIYNQYLEAIDFKEKYGKHLFNKFKVTKLGKHLISIETQNKQDKFIGLFNLSEKEEICVVEETEIINLLNNEKVEIKNNQIKVLKPIIYKVL